MSVTSVNIRTNGGIHYLCAEGGGGGTVNATRTQAMQWETLSLMTADPAALEVASGTHVHLRAANGMYLCAENGGGGDVVANRPSAREWETFVLEKVGGGAVRNGDKVSIRTYDGTHFLCAEGGGGGALNATRTGAREWETFTLGIQSVPESMRVTIDLVTVHCRNTEDLTGADEFYIMGAVSPPTGHPRPVLTSPIKINDGETRGFAPGQARIFDATLKANESVALLLQAYDEDVAHDWKNRPGWIDEMGKKMASTGGTLAAGALVSNPIGWATLAAVAVAGAAVGGLLLVVASDKDDRLGELRTIVPAVGLPDEDQNWNFRQDGWYSGWNYTVHYHIHRDDPAQTRPDGQKRRRRFPDLELPR